MEESRSAPPHEASSGPAAGQPSAPAAPPEIPFGASAAPGDGLVAAGHPGAPLSPDALRTNLADFALAELVRQHRGSFAPLWTIESWAKLLI